MQYTIELVVNRDQVDEQGVPEILKDDLPQAKGVVLMIHPSHYGVSENGLIVQWTKHGEETWKQIFFTFPTDQYVDYSLRVVNTVAESSKTFASLEVSRYIFDDNNLPTLKDILALFGKAGHWTGSLVALFTRNWDLTKSPSILADLGSLPLQLEELDCTVRADAENLAEAATHWNRFARNMPALKTLIISHSNSESWLFPNLLEGLGESCPTLREVSIYEGSGNGPLGKEGVESACHSISNLGSLQSLTISARTISTDAVDKILHAALYHSQIQMLSLNGCKPGPSGVASLLSYLEASEIAVKFLALDFDSLDSEDSKALKRALKMRLGVFSEDDDVTQRNSSSTISRELPSGLIVRVPRRRRIDDERQKGPHINEYLRLYHCKRVAERSGEDKICRLLMPRVLAKINAPKHRTKLFRLLCSQPSWHTTTERRCCDEPTMPAK